MLSRLCLSPSTNHTLLIEIEELQIVLVPMILPVWFPPVPTVPPSFIVRVRNIDLSHVMCHEQPLFRYHDFSFSIPLKHICDIKNFRLMYPNLYGSFRVSTESFTLLLLCLVLEVKWLLFIQYFRFNTFLF